MIGDHCVDRARGERLAHACFVLDTNGARPQAFEAAQAYGVMGMRERARHLGGCLSISSEPGQGCRVVMELPLPVQARP